jgi:hypothetical protein
LPMITNGAQSSRLDRVPFLWNALPQFGRAMIAT